MPKRYKIFCVVLLYTVMVGSKEVEAYAVCQQPHLGIAFSKGTPFPEMTAQVLDKKPDPLLNVYPNPSFGTVTLFIKEDLWQGGTASIYNIIGQLIIEKPIDSTEIAFDLSNQKQGIYLVTVRNGTAHKTLRLERRV